MESHPSTTRPVIRLLVRLEAGLCLGLMVALLALLFLQVVGRLTPWALAWTEEVSRYVFIWIVLFGASRAVRTGDHVALTLLDSRLTGRARATLRVLTAVACAGFGLLLVVLGARQVAAQYIGQNIAYSVPLPLWIVWLGIPLSFALFSGWAFLGVLTALREWRGGSR